jgi:hypothetical protein
LFSFILSRSDPLDKARMKQMLWMDDVRGPNDPNGLFYAHDVYTCNRHPVSAKSRGYFASFNFSKACMAFPSPMYENLKAFSGTISFAAVSKWNVKATKLQNRGRSDNFDLECDLEKSDSEQMVLGRHFQKDFGIAFDKSYSRIGFVPRSRK